MRLFPLMMLPLLTACPSPKEEDDTGTGADDTGTTGSTYFEPGCITVDGGGGYKYIQDAITVAAEGSVIVLCDGTYEEAVVVDKGVEIAGQSREGVILSAPAASAALTITGAGADVHTLTIQTGKDGVVFEAGSSGRVADFSMDAPANYGVSFAGAADAAVEDCAITNSQYTAIKANGGRATVARCTISGSTSVAVDALGGADLVLDGNVIEGVTATTDEDGSAIVTDDATLTMVGNRILGADALGISANLTAISMSGDTIEGTLAAVQAIDGDFTGTGLTISENALLGLILVAPGAVSLSDTVISVADGSACANPYRTLWAAQNNSIACGGLYAGAATVTLSGVTISGYDTYGAFILSYDGESQQTITDLTISDIGRVGALVSPGTGSTTITGGSITGVVEMELADPCVDANGGYDLGYSPALYLSSGAVTIDGMEISGNTGWGISAAGATVTLRNSTVADNYCAGIVNVQGSLTAEGNTFRGGRQRGAVWDYTGATVLTGNVFEGSHDTYSYTSGTDTVEIDNQGLDVQSYGSSTLIVSGNTFQGGENSLLVVEVGDVQITGNTWSDYDSTAMTLSDCASAVVEDNEISDSYGYAVSAYSSTYSPVEISDLAVRRTRPTSSMQRTYDVDGNLISTIESQYSSYEAVYASSITLDLRDLTVEEGDVSYAIYGYDSVISVDGAEVDGVAGFLFAYAFDTAPEMLLEGISAGELTDNLVSLYNYAGLDGTLTVIDATAATAYTGISTIGPMELYVEGLTIGTATTGVRAQATSADPDGDGIYESLAADPVSVLASSFGSVGDGLVLTGGAEILIDGLDITAATGTAISVGAYAYDYDGDGAYETVYADSSEVADRLEITGSTVGSAGSYGVLAFADWISVDGVSVGGSRLTGMRLSAPEISVTGSSAAAQSGDGLYVGDGAISVSGNDFSANGGYGMVCSAVTLTACATNDLSGNALGAHNGCDDACGM